MSDVRLSAAAAALRQYGLSRRDADEAALHLKEDGLLAAVDSDCMDSSAELDRMRGDVAQLEDNWRREWCNQRDNYASDGWDMDTIAAFREDLAPLLNPSGKADDE